jgi:hypothetical protein
MGSDWPATALWSALALGIATPTIYLPAMWFVRIRLRGYRPVMWFLVVAAALGVIPTAMIILMWGGGVTGLLTPEASTFYVMFVVVGCIFGLGYAIKRGDVV